MDPDRWKQVDSLLQAALERAPGERSAFLRQVCAGDAEVEREVRSLLAAQQDAGSFLDRPAVEMAAETIAVSPETEAASLSGRTISHYRIAGKLGAGGMGVVWKARDTRLDRFVALKLLPAGKMSDPERKRRFVQEARAASALNHPNIITIYDIDQAMGADFIAMEYVPGKPLSELIPRQGMRLPQALDYAVQVADALAAAHSAGIVHRDLKPANIMVSESGTVKVLDFGLAKLTERGGSGEFARTETLAETPKTDEGTIVGTFAYMSPEQAEGRKVDSRADIFSFGAVLYEMLTGRRAFSGGSMLSILSAILRDEPKPPAELVPGLPPELHRIVTRCLRKDPNRRYQHAGDLKIDLQQVKEEPVTPAPKLAAERPPAGAIFRRWWLLAAAASLAASFAIGRWFRAPEAAPAAWRLTQITRNAGLSQRPALSPDGKLVAYSADTGQDGGMDLYVKQVAGGQPIRLTSDGAGNTWPAFSPDGSRIVFRSSRDGGGLYEIPAFGGPARRLVRDGMRPRFSPDGSRVAYWVGSEGMVETVPGAASVWVVPAAGGQPQRVASKLTAARTPIWSPDGKRVLFVGYTSNRLYDSSSLDWWIAAVDGNEEVKTGFRDALVRAGLPHQGLPVPCCWSGDTNTVLFSINVGDASNVWEVGIAPRTGKVTGAPRRVSAGAGIEEDISCSSGGALAFTNRENRSNIWSLPFDFDRGTASGPPERITQGPGARGFPSLTSNAYAVAFSSNQSGQSNIWRRELTTGNESIVAPSPILQRHPVISPSGARVAFSAIERDGTLAMYVTSPGGEPDKVCEGCTRATGWSKDEKTLLIYGGAPYQVNLLDPATHQQTPLLKHPTSHVLYGRLSADERWISFTVRTSLSRAHVAIAPFDGPRPIPESAWITIADVWIEDWANWSPDGRTLYFPSARDGRRCLWGQRIDPVSHHPVGEPFAVQHLHGHASYGQNGWSMAAGRIAIALSEDTGNIWLMSPQGKR